MIVSTLVLRLPPGEPPTAKGLFNRCEAILKAPRGRKGNELGILVVDCEDDALRVHGYLHCPWLTRLAIIPPGVAKPGGELWVVLEEIRIGADELPFLGAGGLGRALHVKLLITDLGDVPRNEIPMASMGRAALAILVAKSAEYLGFAADIGTFLRVVSSLQDHDLPGC